MGKSEIEVILIKFVIEDLLENVIFEQRLKLSKRIMCKGLGLNGLSRRESKVKFLEEGRILMFLENSKGLV